MQTNSIGGRVKSAEVVRVKQAKQDKQRNPVARVLSAGGWVRPSDTPDGGCATSAYEEEDDSCDGDDNAAIIEAAPREQTLRPPTAHQMLAMDEAFGKHPTMRKPTPKTAPVSCESAPQMLMHQTVPYGVNNVGFSAALPLTFIFLSYVRLTRPSVLSTSQELVQATLALLREKVHEERSRVRSSFVLNSLNKESPPPRIEADDSCNPPDRELHCLPLL